MECNINGTGPHCNHKCRASWKNGERTGYLRIHAKAGNVRCHDTPFLSHSGVSHFRQKPRNGINFFWSPSMGRFIGQPSQIFLTRGHVYGG